MDKNIIINIGKNKIILPSVNKNKNYISFSIYSVENNKYDLVVSDVNFDIGENKFRDTDIDIELNNKILKNNEIILEKENIKKLIVICKEITDIDELKNYCKNFDCYLKIKGNEAYIDYNKNFGGD